MVSMKNDFEKNVDIAISRHAYERMKERNGWNKKAADRMVQKVYFDGIRPAEVKGYLKSWINRKADTDRCGREYVLYGGKVYVFGQGLLLTVIPTPTRSSLINQVYA